MKKLLIILSIFFLFSCSRENCEKSKGIDFSPLDSAFAKRERLIKVQIKCIESQVEYLRMVEKYIKFQDSIYIDINKHLDELIK